MPAFVDENSWIRSVRMNLEDIDLLKRNCDSGTAARVLIRAAHVIFTMAIPTTREYTPSGDVISKSVGNKCVLWHRRDLRLSDNRAVEYATNHYETVCPLFIFDPQFYGSTRLACDARLRFLHECLADLADEYEATGTTLAYQHGSPVDILAEFLDQGWDIIVTRDSTARYGKQRDETIAAHGGVHFIAEDGIRHQQKNRDGWQEHAESYFQAPTNQPHESGFGCHSIITDVSIEAIEQRYNIGPSKVDVPKGGRTAALNRLDRFLDVIHKYQTNISSPLGAKTYASRLSGHLRFGVLSVREVYQALDDAIDCPAKEAFISRLFWNRHYTQKLADWSGWMDTAVNPVFKDIYALNQDEELIQAWKRGHTGFPMVDASMRCLRDTGWLNFRMRAMCASTFSLVLKQPWQIGADHMYYHLIDADPAINHTQWQSHSGLKGIGAIRLYNPRKQVRDNDPEGAFIKRWVPELEPIPTEHLDRPERMPLSLQSELDIEIGVDYPYPVVDYEYERQTALETFGNLREAATEAFQDPIVYQRASFSPKSRQAVKEATSELATPLDSRTETTDDRSNRQTDLERFTEK